jgi:hypothetical protein
VLRGGALRPTEAKVSIACTECLVQPHCTKDAPEGLYHNGEAWVAQCTKRQSTDTTMCGFEPNNLTDDISHRKPKAGKTQNLTHCSKAIHISIISERP